MAVALNMPEPVRAVAGEDWIPLPPPEPGTDWIEPGSALDFSAVVPHHEPAGKFGRVVAVGDHFELEQRPGEEIRFCGVNLVHGANVPDPENADRFAANLARMGFNSVRIHHHEAFLVGAKPRDDGAEGKRAIGVHLRQEDRRGAAGYEPEEGGHHRLEAVPRH